MHHTLKKKLPPMPVPKNKTQETRLASTKSTQPIRRTLHSDLECLPLLATVFRLLDEAEQRYPGIKNLFYRKDSFELYIDINGIIQNNHPDQLFITSGWLDQNITGRDRWIGIGKYVKIQEEWHHSPTFFMDSEGYPLGYQEYDPEGTITLPVVMFQHNYESHLAKAHNKPLIRDLAREFKVYVEKNRYAQRAQFSGQSLDYWQQIHAKER